MWAAVWCVVVCVCVAVKCEKLTGHPPIPHVSAQVRCFTSVAPSEPIVIEVYDNWSPIGAKHFLTLVKDGYYDGSPLFRVVKGFIVQFGISLNRTLQEKWDSVSILDDPNLGFPFDRGYISYAGLV
jgi:hypothetical protein